MFSATPSCTVTARTASGTPGYCAVSPATTSTSLGVNCWDSTGTLAAIDFVVHCVGPR